MLINRETGNSNVLLKDDDDNHDRTIERGGDYQKINGNRCATD